MKHTVLRSRKQSALANLICTFGSITALSVMSAEADTPAVKTLTIGADQEILLGGLSRGGGVQNQLITTSRRSGGFLLESNGGDGQGVGEEEASAAGDIDGDGYQELIQLYGKPQGTTPTRLNVTEYPSGNPLTQTWTSPLAWKDLALAVGDLDGRLIENTFQERRDEIVIAGIARGSGILQVRAIQSDHSGRLPESGITAQWDTTERVSCFAIGCSDLGANGRAEVVVVYQAAESRRIEIVVLEGGRPNGPLRLSVQRRLSLGEAGPDLSDLVVALGDLDGDFEKEISVAWGSLAIDRPGLVGIEVAVIDATIGEDHRVAELETLSKTGLVSGSLGEICNLQAADLDQDATAELVLCYYDQDSSAGGLTFDAFRFAKPDGEPGPAGQSDFLKTRTWTVNSSYSADRVDMAIGDLDGDGAAEIVAAYENKSDDYEIQVLGTKVRTESRYTINRNPEPGSSISVVLGDIDRDSVFGRFGSQHDSYKESTEYQINFVGFVPPYWMDLQRNTQKMVEIGESTSITEEASKNYTLSSESTVSGYFGGSIDVGVATASIRATAARAVEMNASWNNSKSETIEEGFSSSLSTDEPMEGMVAFNKLTYDCYNYEVRKGHNQPDGALRICQLKKTQRSHHDTTTWEKEGMHASSASLRMSWVPVARDWTNLCLYDRVKVSQSSTRMRMTLFGEEVQDESDVFLPFRGEIVRESYPARLARDGNMSEAGSSAQTQEEYAPWWQADLGEMKEIRLVRLWKGPNSTLKDATLWISPKPFQSKNPQELARDPQVSRFHVSHETSRVANLSTLTSVTRKNSVANAPTIGRYVLVQLPGRKVLSLAEVQIFGPQHQEPDQYPRSVRRTADGFLEVKVFDPELGRLKWVKTRGQLLQAGDLGPNTTWRNYVVSAGYTGDSWHREDCTEEAEGFASSIKNSARIGIEFDVEMGLIGKIQAGGGMEFSHGIESGWGSTKSWNKCLHLTGKIGHFGDVMNSEQWEYAPRPYVYTIEEESSYGYVQKYLVLDYYVPEVETQERPLEHYTPREMWQRRYFDLSDDQQAMGDDANGDGIANIIAYAQNRSPWTEVGAPGGPQAPRVNLSSQSWHPDSWLYQVDIRNDDPDLVVEALLCDDLDFSNALAIPGWLVRRSPGMNTLSFSFPRSWTEQHSQGYMKLIYRE